MAAMSRMHLTLEQEGMNALNSLEDQIKNLDKFSEYYNFIRPHESLNQKRPADVYCVSPRYWSGRLESPEYSNEFKVGRVKSCGKMSWKQREVYIGRMFEGEPIGLKQEDVLKAYYGPIFLGVVRENKLEFERRPGRKKFKNLNLRAPPMGELRKVQMC